MTYDEHVARALLLGATFKAWMHCYVFEKADRMASEECWIDADTMQELTHDEKFERLNRSINAR